MNDDELERLLRTPERPVPLAPFASLERRARGRPSRVVPALAVVAAMVVGLVAGVRLTELRQQQAASPTRTPDAGAASASPSPAPDPSASASPASGRLTHENAILGYRMTLPEAYRRTISRIDTAAGARGGLDYYTVQTEREAREECERDAGHVGGPGLESDIRIYVATDTSGLSAREWATTPRAPGAQPRSMHKTVEDVAIGGHEAVRLAWEQTGETSMYVIRANDRMYEIGPEKERIPSPLPKGWLDDIVRTFVALSPPPFPTPSPLPRPPRESAQGLANALAEAFAARDADAVARLMPDCWVVGGYLVDGEQPGMGGINRSVTLFARALRERFARGDLAVTVDRELHIDERRFGGYYVRSQWREPDRTIRVDLALGERDGRWIWWAFLHHFGRADLVGGSCAPLRSPWASGSC